MMPAVTDVSCRAARALPLFETRPFGRFSGRGKPAFANRTPWTDEVLAHRAGQPVDNGELYAVDMFGHRSMRPRPVATGNRIE